MATLVLTTAGSLIGGPVGGAIGALIGNSIDQAIFAPKGRQGPRLDDLSVQSSAYGAPLAHLFGTIRATGNIIWSRGLKETAHRSGGGKRSGGRTTTYSYSASFAVALSARRIARIGRIWGDGKLLRGASGELTAEGTLRIYRGDELQVPDPLIVAAEGSADAPAYRGLAYAVFEDLELGDFANRIPNLSFEVVADAAAPTVGGIASALCAAAGGPAAVQGLARSVQGFAAARNAPLATWISSLSTLSPIRVGEAGRQVLLHDITADSGVALTPQSIVAGREAGSSEARTAPAKTAGAVTIGFLDPARDYLAGLQRASRTAGDAREEHFELPAVLAASDAKRTAQQLLERRWSQRDAARRRLSYRAIGVAPGDRLRAEDGRIWEVRRTSIERMTVEVEMEPVAAVGRHAAPADGGRANTEPDMPQGDTRFHVLELPPMGSELPSLPRLWIAAGGTGPGWRRAEIWTSRDAGSTWSSVGLASGGAPIGQTLGVLAAADATRWDESGSIDIELISDAMWIESRSALSVLAGANHALVGDEIIQFRHAEALAPRLFRLRGLLRGRRATESAIAGHAAGERFIALTDGAMFALDPPIDAIGSTLDIRLVAPNLSFAEAPEIRHRIAGRSLRPLSPAHLDARAAAGGDIRIAWTRRSRAGFGWIDGADAALAEDREDYVLRCTAGDATFETETGRSPFVLGAAQQMSSFGALPGELRVEIAQLSGVLGAGESLVRNFNFNR